VSSTLYYAEPGVEVHCGRVEDVLATIDPKTVALLSADPPYGIGLATGGRGTRRNRIQAKPPRDRAYAPVEGDDRAFDPSLLLQFPRVSLWGANHYADRLPSSPSWILWDKRDGSTPDNGSDAEMCWTNLGGPVRMFRHLWKGVLRASEAGAAHEHLHPTQKPVALYSWLFQWRTKPGDLIVAPYAGSGPDVLAARNLGRRIIAIECVESYCAEIVKRLRQPMLPGLQAANAPVTAPQTSFLDP
jgi:site-specific DNA-methyltransferase (adenine-specific)/modification methylase